MTNAVPVQATLIIPKPVSAVSLTLIVLIFINGDVSEMSFALNDLRVSEYIEKKCEQLATEIFCDYCQFFDDSTKWNAEQIEKAVAIYHNFLDDTFACKECYEEEKGHIRQLRESQNEDSMQLGTDYLLYGIDLHCYLLYTVYSVFKENRIYMLHYKCYMKVDLVRSERKEIVEFRLKKRSQIVAENRDLFEIIKAESEKWKE